MVCAGAWGESVLIRKLQPGERAPYEANRICLNRLADGRISWTGSVDASGRPYAAQVAPTSPPFRRLRRTPSLGRERVALRNFKSRDQARRRVNVGLQPIAGMTPSDLLR